MMQEILFWIASALCVLIGLGAVILIPKGFASWCFFIGMVLLALERQLDLRVAQAGSTNAVKHWLMLAMWVMSLAPIFWLSFSLTYARGSRGEFLWRWRWILLVAVVVPSSVMMGAAGRVLELSVDRNGETVRFLVGGEIWLISITMLTLGALLNLERSFRASVGMTRWRIKYMFLGMAMIFGVKIYTLSQILLFSTYDPALARLSSLSVILGCGLIAIGHLRTGFRTIDLYPSRAILQGSLTVIVAGGYFLIVGVLAQVVALLGGIASFPAQALVVLIGLVGLSILLLSDRFRTTLQRFVSRHFRRSEHDFRKIWTEFTRRTSSVFDEVKLGTGAAEVISNNFHVLGVTVFRASPDTRSLGCLCSSEKQRDRAQLEFSSDWMSDIQALEKPFNLERCQEAWASVLRDGCPTKFDHGGDRLVIPLVAAERLVGLVVLADRVNGVPYSHEEVDLLACIGDQLAAALMSCSLTEKVLLAKEMEAFQTLSTFFVHDLKNAANSLNLTLQNLPVHFDDPEFRADAVKAVSRTVARINQMIQKLSSLRHETDLRLVPCRLDLLCGEVLDSLDSETKMGCQIRRDLTVVPEHKFDREAMHSVVTNLVINAREAMSGNGSVQVSTRLEDGKLALTVADEGIGMSADFIKNQLFRPFHSTKTKGLGIGLFQCKKIVEAHRGSIRVDSAPGHGTRFTVLFPSSPGYSLASTI